MSLGRHVHHGHGGPSAPVVSRTFSSLRQEEKTHGKDGPLASDRGVREKLAIASSETYKMLRADMSEIIKTSDWRRARGVGFNEVPCCDDASV